MQPREFFAAMYKSVEVKGVKQDGIPRVPIFPDFSRPTHAATSLTLGDAPGRSLLET
jgi:hypothetical protein